MGTIPLFFNLLLICSALSLELDGWPLQFHDPQQSSRSSAVGPSSLCSVNSLSFEKDAKPNQDIKIGADGVVYLTTDTMVIAYNSDFVPIWQSNSSSGIYALDNKNQILYGSRLDTQYQYHIDLFHLSNGSYMYSFQLQENAYFTIDIGNTGYIYYMNAISSIISLFCIDPLTSQQIYKTDYIPAFGSMYISNDPPMLFAFNTVHSVGINKETGQLMWNNSISGELYALGKGVLFIATKYEEWTDCYLYCLSMTTGTTIWRAVYSTGSTAIPNALTILNNGQIAFLFQSNDNNYYTNYYDSEGNLLDSYKMTSNSINYAYSYFFDAKDKVYLCANDVREKHYGGLYIFDLLNKKKLYSKSFQEENVVSTMALAQDGTLYTMDKEGIHSFKCENEWTNWKFILTVVLAGIDFVLLVVVFWFEGRFKLMVLIDRLRGRSEHYHYSRLSEFGVDEDDNYAVGKPTKSLSPYEKFKKFRVSYGLVVMVTTTIVGGVVQYQAASNVATFTKKLNNPTQFFNNYIISNNLTAHDPNLCFCTSDNVPNTKCSLTRCDYTPDINCSTIIRQQSDCLAAYFQWNCDCKYQEVFSNCDGTSVTMTTNVQPIATKNFHDCKKHYDSISNMLWGIFGTFLAVTAVMFVYTILFELIKDVDSKFPKIIQFLNTGISTGLLIAVLVMYTHGKVCKSSSTMESMPGCQLSFGFTQLEQQMYNSITEALGILGSKPVISAFEFFHRLFSYHH